MRIHRRDRGLRIRRERHPRPDGLEAVLDPRRVEGGVDAQPALEQGVPALLVRLPEGSELAARVLQDLPGDVLDEERVPGLETRAGVLRQADRRAHGLFGLILGNPTQVGHPLEHHVPSPDRRLRVADRVPSRRPGDHPRERRGLLQVQGCGVLSEIELRRGLDPVHAVAEENVVQVQLQDLPLRVVPVHLDRFAGLRQLASKRVGRPSGHVLHQLLGDRRAALRELSGSDVGDCRADDRLRIDSAVVVEAVILDGEYRAPRDGSHVVQVDDDPVLVEVQASEHRSVGCIDRRPLREARELDVPCAVASETPFECPGGHPEAVGEREKGQGHEHGSARHGHERRPEPYRHGRRSLVAR
jgi:hypothetical protein